MVAQTYDAAVIGVGAMGSAACYHLARRGLSVLGLERFTIPNAMGSHHGATRAIRFGYAEGDIYAPLLMKARELWQAAEAETGQRRFFQTGVLEMGAADSAWVNGSRRSAEAQNLELETLSAAGVKTRFPMFDPPGTYQAIFQKDGGFLASERAVTVHADLARRQGANLLEHTGLTAWESGPNGFHLYTDEGEYRARRVVFTAGAWMGRLIPELEPFLTAQRQILGWFEPPERRSYAPDVMPVWAVDIEGYYHYGFPEWGLPGLKTGCHRQDAPSADPETLDRAAVTEEDEALLRRGLSRVMPKAAASHLLDLKTCLYTTTPDGRFILDRHPYTDGMVLISACSGHGFKFASVIGEIAADLAEFGETRHAIAPFALGRFRG